MICGRACGSVAYRNAATGAAPLMRRVASGCGGRFSRASANSRPSTPAVCAASASVPANGPRPAAISRSEAHTSSGIERRTLSSMRAAARGAAPKRPAAGSASSRPHAAASSVPSADIASVSKVATAEPCAGRPAPVPAARSRAGIRCWLCSASVLNRSRHFSGRVTKLAITSSRIAASRNRVGQSRGGAAGGTSLRGAPLIPASAAAAGWRRRRRPPAG